MPDRLSIMNDALVNTGNNRITVEFEDTFEWDVAKTAYDRFLPQLLEAHPWNFATKTEALQQATENLSQIYDYAYLMPGDALWLSGLYRNGGLVEYEILDDKLCCDFDNASTPIMAKYVRNPGAGAMTHTFWEAMRKFVESGCLRGLNEENAEASRREQEGWMMLRNAAARSDQQAPRRGFLKSAAISARGRGRYRRRGVD